ncbi:phosphoribosylformylglycinamidine synthase subunit PurL [Yaniella sp.]|uniref:phosphoribosylformylglycinamidine synthase subunit PurL n=1 Tax=Yaniella sp. TaxID=2773929 RepID=UPI00264A10C2|nr:phosphoribosylformylglycinamidine synthase subunit PurL [Yaniella sp.]MDN6358966.1 phosphoribosylformylglycinamidine synthase subunit PurL [Yaniella sp.]
MNKQQLDTVDYAAETPEQEQPWAALGLNEQEYQRIREIMGRRPTEAELAMYSSMWSEHTSHKSSKVHLKQFGQKTTEAMQKHMLVGLGENAGVVDLGDGWAVTFKVESHNSPSYLEPFQGAATGIGGVVRDIISMGARPVAVLDALRIGHEDHEDTARIVKGAVAGVGHYGNILGVPNIAGETDFDPVFQGNPLVNAGAVGVLRHEDLRLAQASGAGNKIVLFGARTGGDGIGGAAMSSASFDDEGAANTPVVQAGDPLQENVIIEATLELFSKSLVEGIQDLGAAGIACATSELAAGGDGGMHIELTNVLLRDQGLSAGDILMAESQERMMAVVTPDNTEAFEQIMHNYGVEYSWLGEVNDSGRLTIDWNGERIVDVDPVTVADDSPVYERPYARPASQDALQADTFRASAAAANLPSIGDELKAAVVELMGSANMADRSWITAQTDTSVGGNTRQGAPNDSGVIRVDEETGMGIGLAIDCNSRYAYLDPYKGSQLAVAESYRNVATSGATPLGISDGLNFGSPENPDVMWQFAESTRGIADACQELGIPVTGGNVSLYNQTVDTPIHPTPMIVTLGRYDDVTTAVPSWLHPAFNGSALYLLGETFDELDGSQFAHLRGHLGGVPPKVDLAQETRLAGLLSNASRTHMLDAAHDLSEGGLAGALADMVLQAGVGARINLEYVTERDNIDAFTALFSESQARAIVAVPLSEEVRFRGIAESRRYPALRIGVVDADSGALEIQDLFSASIAELREGWASALPKRFGN